MSFGSVDVSIAELQAKDSHFLHPWQHFATAREGQPTIIEKGEGVYVYDAEGMRYIDGIAGLWCVNIGYGRKELADAMAKQAFEMPYFSTFGDTTNRPAAELAHRLADLAPGSLNHVIFATCGSDANDSAIRLAHYYQGRRGKPEKKNIISRTDAYHGSTYLGSSLGGKPADRIGYFQYITDFIHHLSSPNAYRRPEGLSEADFCKGLLHEFDSKIEALGAETVAAFIAEPIMGAGGVIVPPHNYLKAIRQRCKDLDILYISDEVVTAFGRLGHMFASYDEFGIVPDMIVTAKGITSGYIPLGATLYSDEIHDVINGPDDAAYFAHGFTYSGHPVACAVGLKNIDLIVEEKICENAAVVGDYFEQQAKTLIDLPFVGDVRGRRFMMCIEYVGNKETKELLPAKINISKRIANACGSRGLIVRPIGHLNIMSPPLTLTMAQVDEVVEILRASVLEVHKDLQVEGLI